MSRLVWFMHQVSLNKQTVVNEVNRSSLIFSIEGLKI